MSLKFPSHTSPQARQAAAFLESKLSQASETAIILGTGLGDTVGDLQIDVCVDYGDIPYFPVSTVQSHMGRMICGQWAQHPVLIMQGRFHLYEGYSSLEVTFPIRVLQALGIKTLIITNASGGLNPDFRAGDIMIIRDHINLTGENPLIGPNDDDWGPRFPGMTSAYTSDMSDRMAQVGKRAGIRLQEGVYVGLKGPSLETPAEMRFLKTIGADAVGFSTVMETIAAVHAGMNVIGMSTITNMCLPDALVDTSVEEIIATAQGAAPKLELMISNFLKEHVSY